MPRLLLLAICIADNRGQLSEARSGKMGPAPGRFELFKGHFEVKINNGLGI